MSHADRLNQEPQTYSAKHVDELIRYNALREASHAIEDSYGKYNSPEKHAEYGDNDLQMISSYLDNIKKPDVGVERAETILDASLNKTNWCDDMKNSVFKASEIALNSVKNQEELLAELAAKDKSPRKQ